MLQGAVSLSDNTGDREKVRLKGRVAIIAGGSGDIGRGLCYEFAKEGALVNFTYLRSEDLAKEIQ